MKRSITPSENLVNRKAPAFMAGIFLFVLCICILLFHILYTPMVTKAPAFFDLIIEATAESGYHKAGELALFRLLAIAGCLLVGGGVFLVCRKTGGAAQLSEHTSEESGVADGQKETGELSLGGWRKFLPLLLLLLALIYLAVSGIFSLPLFFMAGYTALMLPLTEQKDYPYVCLLPPLSYYGLLGILMLLCCFSQRFALSQNALYLLTMVMTAFCLIINLFMKKKENDQQPLKKTVFRRLLFALQLPVPLLLTIYFRDGYLYEGDVIREPYAAGYYVLILLILAALYVRLILSSVKKQAVISAVTPIVLFAYRSWQACPAFAQPDQHHHGEQLIPWQQIVTLGQRAYDEYTPVSGLFPMVNGFIQHVFLKGTVADYAPALSLTTLLFALLTMALVCRHIKPEKAMLFAAVFSLPSYNRQYMVAPLLLLFFDPALLKRRSAWLKVWLMGCFLGGLYYPLFGAAVCTGTLPLAICQAVSLFRGFAFGRQDIEKKGARVVNILTWLIVLIPIALCLPLLYRMAVHTLTYSSQTILADGISLAGQTPPDTFLPYLAGTAAAGLRDSLYLIFRFFLPMLWLWFAAALMGGQIAGGNVLRKRHPGSEAKTDTKVGTSKAANCDLQVKLHFAFALLTTLAVSYTYTLVRADRQVILARTAPVLIAVGGMFAGVMLLEHFLSERSAKTLPAAGLFMLCMSLIFLCYAHVNDMKNPYLWTYPDGNEQLVASDASRLFTRYEVPETFVFMGEIPLSDNRMLGNGFMVEDQIPYLTQYDRVKKRIGGTFGEEESGVKRADDQTYMGYDGQGFYYYMGTKACAAGYLPVARSRQAQQRILDVAMEKRPVVFSLDPQKSFYIWRWLLSEEADYRYLAEDDAYYPAEIYDKMAGNDPALSKEGDDPAETASDIDFERICQSFGESAELLLANLTDKENKGAAAFAGLPDLSSFAGRDFELLYLALDMEKTEIALGSRPVKLTAVFSDMQGGHGQVSCDVGGGKLLLPLGMHLRWQTGQIRELSFILTDENGKTLSLKAGEMEQYLLAEGLQSGLYRIKD